jgi:glycosyltransferase involved in cell wall biosynthesis
MSQKIIVLGTRGFPKVQGGIEKHCEELYPRLVKSGCDVTVFARAPYFSKIFRVDKWHGVRFKYLWCLKNKNFEAIFHTCIGVFFARFYSPDLLHVHAVGPALIVPIARMLGLKVVFTHHGPDYKRSKWGFFAKKILKIGEFFGVKCANKVIAVSEEIQQKAIKEYGKKDMIFIPNGANMPEKNVSSDMLIKFDVLPKKYIFAVGRFVSEKGLHDLISAYKKINNQDFKLVIAGDDYHGTDYGNNLKKQAKESGVVLTGFISGKPLEELFLNAGLFVLPSCVEGLPIVLLEALSYNLPVLVSDIPSHREVKLNDNRYFKLGNIDELSKKIIELFNDGVSNEEKENYNKLLLEKYNWVTIAEKTFAVYKSLV